MKFEFKDYFSNNSDEYGLYRPHYPNELYRYLSSITIGHQRAWDCATGTGQAALGLSQYYSEVIGTDASKLQINNTPSKTNIVFQVAPAECTNIESRSVDLITVAQALHWFDIEAFAREIDRVLVPSGVIAAWTYNLMKITPKIDRVINKLYKLILKDYWPKERAMVEDEYRSISLPFTEIEAPSFQMSVTWNINHLLGYLETWSAVNKYKSETGCNPIDTIIDETLSLWGNPEDELQVNWPLRVRLWSKLDKI